MEGAELRADRLRIEETHLIQAEQDIAAGQMRITEQELRIEALRAGGRTPHKPSNCSATWRRLSPNGTGTGRRLCG